MNTLQFQRLRWIQQLGVCSFVFPAATHTRFVHSLGVAHLALKVLDHLMEVQPNLRITLKEKDTVMLAGEA